MQVKGIISCEFWNLVNKIIQNQVQHFIIMLPCWENKEYKTKQNKQTKQNKIMCMHGSAVLCNITVILVWSGHRYLLMKGISARLFGSPIIITHFYQCHEMHFLRSWCVSVTVRKKKKKEKEKKTRLQCGVVIKYVWVSEWVREREHYMYIVFFFSFLFSLYFHITYFIRRPSYINAVDLVLLLFFFFFPAFKNKN